MVRPAKTWNDSPRAVSFCSASDGDVQRRSACSRRDDDFAAATADVELDEGIADLELRPKVVERRRQLRPMEQDATLFGVDLEAERGGDQEIRRRRCPGLGSAGDGIERGPLARTARKATKELRQ